MRFFLIFPPSVCVLVFSLSFLVSLDRNPRMKFCIELSVKLDSALDSEGSDRNADSSSVIRL